MCTTLAVASEIAIGGFSAESQARQFQERIVQGCADEGIAPQDVRIVQTGDLWLVAIPQRTVRPPQGARALLCVRHLSEGMIPFVPEENSRTSETDFLLPRKYLLPAGAVLLLIFLFAFFRQRKTVRAINELRNKLEYQFESFTAKIHAK